MSARLGVSLAAGSASAALLYSMLRLVQAWLLPPEPDPALVLWTAHSGFFWRAWTCAYAGGTVAFLVWMLAGRGVERPARVLAKSIVPVAIAVLLQALFVP